MLYKAADYKTQLQAYLLLAPMQLELGVCSYMFHACSVPIHGLHPAPYAQVNGWL